MYVSLVIAYAFRYPNWAGVSGTLIFASALAALGFHLARRGLAKPRDQTAEPRRGFWIAGVLIAIYLLWITLVPEWTITRVHWNW